MRLRAEEALRISENTARTLLNAPSDFAMLVDRQFNVLAINAAGAKRFNTTPEAMVGTNIRPYMHPNLAKSRLAQIATVFASGNPIHFEDERAGRQFANSCYPVFDANGQVSRVAVYGRDITEWTALPARPVTYWQLRALTMQSTRPWRPLGRLPRPIGFSSSATNLIPLQVTSPFNTVSNGQAREYPRSSTPR